MPDLIAITRAVAIALACAGALTATNWLTDERIQYNESAALRSAIADLLPAGDEAPAIPPVIDRVPGLWTLCTGHLLGRSDVPGYGGDIRLLYTLRMPPAAEDTAATTTQLIRLSVLGHQETPGIADFLTSPEWLRRFADRKASEVSDLSAITGATITSTAVRDHLTAVLRAPEEQLGAATATECAF